MTKTILLTGATDGIGLETAKMLAASGHTLLLHGRNPAKLESAADAVRGAGAGGVEAGGVETYRADLSVLAEARDLGDTIAARGPLDVVINNAGILGSADPITSDGLDVRLAVNTLAPYILAKALADRLGRDGRVVNVSSAAQAPVDMAALTGGAHIADMSAYSQSKLAITMWSRHMAVDRAGTGPIVVSVNPGSLLGSKMVKEGFGIAGGDLSKGADILTRAAVSDEFADATGKYYDNDAGRFGPPHAHAEDDAKCAEMVRQIEDCVARVLPS